MRASKSVSIFNIFSLRPRYHSHTPFLLQFLWRL